MNYQSEILQVLREADPKRGLSIANIAHHVCNMTNRDLFEVRDYEDIRRDVTKFLRSESAKRGSAIEKTEKRGFYRLNPSSLNVQQLTLRFNNEEPF